MIRDIDFDDIALLQQTKGASCRRFGADMTDGCATACAAETPVCNQCNAFIQLHPCQSTRRIQHFTHTGTALGTFVSDDNNISGMDAACVDGCDGILFAVKHTRRACMAQHFGVNCASLYHTAILCDIPPQNRNAACFAIGVINGANQIVVLNVCTLDIFAQRFACCCHSIQIQQTIFRKLCLYRRDTACSVQVGDMGGAGRCQMAQVGYLCGNFIEDIHIQIYTCFVCNRQQMQYAVGGAAQCHITGNCIINASGVDDISCLDIPFHQFHDCHACVLCQLHTSTGNIGQCAIAGQSDTNRFTQTVHAVCGIHSCTGATAGAGIGFIFKQLCIINHICFSCADCLEHLGQADFLIIHQTGHHCTAGANHSRDIHTHCRHYHTGNDFIAVGYENQTIQRMRHCHRFHAVRNQLTACKAIFHAGMPHRDTITNADGRNHDGCAARHAHACLDGFCNLIQIEMSGNNFAVCGNYANQRSVQFFLRISHCIKQASCRCSLYALCYLRTSQLSHKSSSFFLLLQERRASMLRDSPYLSNLIFSASSSFLSVPCLHGTADDLPLFCGMSGILLCRLRSFPERMCLQMYHPEFQPVPASCLLWILL